MKQFMAFSIVLIFAIYFTGCGAAADATKEVAEFLSSHSDQGVVVVNTMPDTRLYVVAEAVYGREVFGKGIIAGTQCFVPAAMYPQSQTFVITVHAYGTDGEYLGSRSRQFSFSNSGGRNYRNEQWDVRKWDLVKN